MLLKALLILATLSLLSTHALWMRYRDDRLLTPAGGLHLQILIFFCLGGFCFLGFPSVEPRLADDEMAELTYESCLPLLIGYAIVCALEFGWRRSNSDGGGIQNRLDCVGGNELLVLLIVGFASNMLAATETAEAGANVIASYLSLVFFPSILLLISRVLGQKATIRGHLGIVAATLVASVFGFYSPWRSILVILGFTILFAIFLKRPRWLPATFAIGFCFLMAIVPFQLIKRANFEEFQEAPVAVIGRSLEVDLDDRLVMVGEFFSRRLSYVRELAYVNDALDSGMSLASSETSYFEGLVQQMVPRMLWPDKPALAYAAGFSVPRQIGLLSPDDPGTSWSVNMFAEAVYHFSSWDLVWFVPLVFYISELIQRSVRRVFKVDQARLIANISAFYLFLSTTTAIFLVSTLVALLAVVKVFDIWFKFRSQQTQLGFN
jgi:hypothetical protein